MPQSTDEALDLLLRQIAETPRVDGGPRRVRVGAELAGRFEVLRKLGEGGMGQVFAAFDRVRETQVAIKVVDKVTTRSVAQLKREFRAAAELVHPNLVRLHELFVDGIEWFFSMDFVEGVTLPSLLKQAPESNTELLREVFSQLALALNALHQGGLIHGDLKPSNFLVGAEDHRVVLLDFGVARPIGFNEELGGTPPYMAPEQALGQRLAESADWYSFGVVLHEALTGALPPRIPPSAALENVSGDLRDLCARLLHLRAEDRPSAREIMEILGIPLPAAHPSTIPPSSGPALIGREPELARLAGMLEETSAGRPAIALVHGPSGIGKTALGTHFVAWARASNATVLTGRCRERESIAYKAIDGVIDDLVAVLERMGLADAQACLPRDLSDLILMFPALRSAAAVADAPRREYEPPDHGLVKQRAVAALCELLENIRGRGPLLVWVDDLQWSDVESALVLAPLLGGRQPVPLLFLGSFRSDGAGPPPVLAALLGDASAGMPTPVELGLGPLEDEDAERMALQLLPRTVAEARTAARNIGSEAQGHPLFIAELAHGVKSAALSSIGETPTTLSSLIAQRLACLSPSARGLLVAVTIAVTPLSRAVLRQAQRLAKAEAEEAFDLLRAHRLVRSQGTKDTDAVDIHHDRVRDIILQEVGEAERQHCHSKLARVLEARDDTKPDVLAAHYEAIGDRARAGRYWLGAAEAAVRSFAFAHASELFERGLEQAVLEPLERRRIRIRLAEVLGYAGKGAQGAEVYLAVAADCARDEAIELRRRAAEALLLSGHLDRGWTVIDQVLQAIGMREARSVMLSMASLATRRMRLKARGLNYSPRTESDLSREELVRLDASWTIASSLGVFAPIRGAAFQARHFLLALQAGEPKRLMRALLAEASYTAARNFRSQARTAKLLALAEELSRLNPDYAAIGLLHLVQGLTAYLQERLDVGIAHCEEALEVLSTRSAGAVWETITAQRFMVASLFFRGHYQRLSEYVPPLLEKAEVTGNLYAMMWFRAGYSTVGWLVRHEVALARAHLERAREGWTESGFQLSHCNLLVGQTFVDLYQGEVAQASGRIVDAWPAIARSRLLNIGVVGVQLWQLRAACAAGAADAVAARGDHAYARELRKDAARAIARLRADRSQRAGPMADLTQAALYAQAGGADAVAVLERCDARFVELGLTLYAAAARVRRGELTRGELGRTLESSGYAELQRERVVEPKRMVALLAPGFPRAG